MEEIDVSDHIASSYDALFLAKVKVPLEVCDSEASRAMVPPSRRVEPLGGLRPVAGGQSGPDPLMIWLLT
jgi:hypothetical protein